jgi:hypothetical protein
MGRRHTRREWHLEVRERANPSCSHASEKKPSHLKIKKPARTSERAISIV